MRDSDDEGGEEEAADDLSVADALLLVRNPDVQTTAGAPVQQDAFRRVSRYVTCQMSGGRTDVNAQLSGSRPPACTCHPRAHSR